MTDDDDRELQAMVGTSLQSVWQREHLLGVVREAYDRGRRAGTDEFAAWLDKWWDGNLEAWFRVLRWSDDTPEEILTLVHGNVRGFASALREALRLRLEVRR